MSLPLASKEMILLPRKQSIARRVAKHAYPHRCCVVCGLQIETCIMIAHLDHQGGNNDPDNLAFMCQTHHRMYDCGFYPLEAIKLLRVHWQFTKGVPSHKARMKDAGVKAARSRKLSAGARKAWQTRRTKST
jgi:hypothetical protein